MADFPGRRIFYALLLIIMLVLMVMRAMSGCEA
jgi:hypothetical protein